MKQKFVIEDAVITVEGKSGGRQVSLKTQTKAKVTVSAETPDSKYWASDRIFSDPTVYGLDVALEKTNGVVFTIKRFPIKVTRTATAEFHPDTDVVALRKTLGVPGEGYLMKINKDQTQVTYSWEEEVN